MTVKPCTAPLPFWASVSHCSKVLQGYFYSCLSWNCLAAPHHHPCWQLSEHKHVRR